MRLRCIAPAALVALAVGGASAASITLTGTVRDFKGAGEPGGHPDFENGLGVDPGIVLSVLGGDDKPVYAGLPGNPTTHGAVPFGQWYNDTPGVNMTGSHSIVLDDPDLDGIYVYSNPSFFPIDGMLFGNTPGWPHNYHFTYELHTNFTYSGGEVFTFTGDDDLWVFINDQLAIDLGGVHGAMTSSVDLDAAAGALGLSLGGNYSFDLFFAERHTTASSFTVSTSIVLQQQPGPSIPEPGTLSLLGLALPMLLRRRRIG